MKPSSSPNGQSVWKLQTWLASTHSPEFSQWKNSPHAESDEMTPINHNAENMLIYLYRN